jgi:hypothetical protein
MSEFEDKSNDAPTAKVGPEAKERRVKAKRKRVAGKRPAENSLDEFGGLQVMEAAPKRRRQFVFRPVGSIVAFDDRKEGAHYLKPGDDLSLMHGVLDKDCPR